MTNVADLQIGGEDALKQKITCFYGRKAPEYAVYRVRRRVLVHYADDEAVADRQRKELSQLAPLRGEIEGLIDGWRDGSNHRFFGSDNSSKLQSKAVRYDRRVGDALVVALESDLTGAQLLLSNIKQNILDERTAWARFEYLIAAFIAALASMFGAWLLGSLYPSPTGVLPKERIAAVGFVTLTLALLIGVTLFLTREQGRSRPRAVHRSAARQGVHDEQDPPHETGGKGEHAGSPSSLVTSALLTALLVVPIVAIFFAPRFTYDSVHPDYATAVDIWRAVAAGAVGAFFSIALGIRRRTVLPDLLRMSNVMDAVLRVVIGIIAAAVLMVLVRTELVSFNFGGQPRVGDESLFVLLFGFLAGFSERLVPDLLEKTEFKPSETPSMLGGDRPSSNHRQPAPPPPATVASAAGPALPNDSDPLPEEAAEDCCAESVDLDDDEVTPDADLPPAAGGVAPAEGEVR